MRSVVNGTPFELELAQGRTTAILLPLTRTRYVFTLDSRLQQTITKFLIGISILVLSSGI